MLEHTKLLYTNNFIDNQKAQTIVQAISNHPEAGTLEIQDCFLTDEAVDILSDMLETNHSISTLNFMCDLTDAWISTASIKRILSALSKNSTIQLFHMSNIHQHQWDEDTCTQLKHLLKMNATLQSITLLSEDALEIDEELVYILKDHYTLQSLTLSNNVPDRMVQIQSYLTRNNSLFIFYTNYKTYFETQDRHNYGFYPARSFILQHCRLTDTGEFLTDNEKLIELYYFVHLHPLLKKGHTMRHEDLKEIKNLLSLMKKHPHPKFSNAFNYFLDEFSQNQARHTPIASGKIKLLMLQIIYKLPFHPKRAHFEIDCIFQALGFNTQTKELDLNIARDEERSICYQRIVDILAPEHTQLSTELNEYLQLAMSASQSPSLTPIHTASDDQPKIVSLFFHDIAEREFSPLHFASTEKRKKEIQAKLLDFFDIKWAHTELSYTF